MELFSDEDASILTKIFFSEPKFCICTSPKFKEDNTDRTLLMLILFSELTSIRVPPLKSIPKFKPLRKREKIEKETNSNRHN